MAAVVIVFNRARFVIFVIALVATRVVAVTLSVPVSVLNVVVILFTTVAMAPSVLLFVTVATTLRIAVAAIFALKFFTAHLCLIR